MRTVVVLLLLALQCLDGVWALKCHQCAARAETCSGPKQCPSQSRACYLERATIVENQTMISHTEVIKTCVQSCQNSPVSSSQQQRLSFAEFSIYISCCTTDLCNAAPGRGFGATTIGMMLLAPVLATLLGDFL